jgi:cytochrome c2
VFHSFAQACATNSYKNVLQTKTFSTLLISMLAQRGTKRKPAVHHGEATCQHLKCTNHAYYESAGTLLCGVHSRNKARKELPKFSSSEKEAHAAQAWEDEQAEIEAAAEENRLHSKSKNIHFKTILVQCVCCVLRVACCVLRVACCVLRVACCVLRVTCCSIKEDREGMLCTHSSFVL